MEFDFNINHIFKGRISKLDHRIRLPNSNQRDSAHCRSLASTVIDKLGAASSKAQGLRIPVTSSLKLEISDHYVYLMKDSEANRAMGAAIGFLKIGRKMLFMYDNRGAIHELQPLCVLDFYIHESHQRQGFGKELFDYMLKIERIQPFQLAIDKPSFKFSSFLKKHYNLCHSIPQTNNFVIFQGFFDGQIKGINGKGKMLPRRFVRYSYKNHHDHERSCQSADIHHKLRDQNAGCEPNKPELLQETNENNTEIEAASPAICMEKSPSSNLAAENVHTSSSTHKHSGEIFLPNMLPSEKSVKPTAATPPQLLSHQSNESSSNYLPVNQLYATTSRRQIPVAKNMATSQLTSAPLATTYSRHLSALSRKQADNSCGRQDYKNEPQKAAAADFVHRTSPLKKTNTDTVSYHTDKYPAGQHVKISSYMDAPPIRLPLVDKSSFHHLRTPSSTFTAKHMTGDTPWSLFSNTSNYQALLHRGYSHTHLW